MAVVYPDLKRLKELNKSSVNRYIANFYTYLCWAVKENDIKTVTSLLEIGCDPNGITDIGLSKKIPLTSVDFTHHNYKSIVIILLKNGADIKGEDLRGHSFITTFFEYLTGILSNNKLLNKIQYEDFIGQLLFILQRGSDPNGTIFFNPLIYCVKILDKVTNPSLINFLFDIFEILVSYGANPNCEIVELSRANNIYTTAKKDLKFGKKYDSIKKLFSLTTEDVVKDCNSKRLVLSLSKFYKIPVDEEKALTPQHLNELCKCLKVIKNNEQEYDEKIFSNLRGKVRRMNKINCVNDELLMGESIDSFPDKELIYLKEKNPSLTYCFHVSDIPSLLKNGTNPYNNKKLDKKFLEDVTSKYKYVMPKTLEESLKNVFDSSEVRITGKILLEKLSNIVKTFNTYIEAEKISDLSYFDMIELLNMLYEGNPHLIEAMVPHSDRMKLIGESEAEAKQRLLLRCTSHLLIYISINGLPFASNVINQLILDVSCSKQILGLFPVFKRRHIQMMLAMYNHNGFINNFQKYIIRDMNDVSLIINDRKFINSLSDHQKEVIQFLEYPDFAVIYKKYIEDGIKDIIEGTFGKESSINDIWINLIPSMRRRSE